MAEVDPDAAPELPRALHAKLSLMMFLQYAIWGAWLPLLWPFLSGHRGFAPGEIGDMFAVGAVGAIVAPFVAGQVADRWFATEKYLALSHVVGGLLVWNLATLESYGAFLAFSLAYSLIYSPTLSLTNSLAFHHLPDRDRDFGKVRLWGTVGWIAAGLAIGQWLYRVHTPDAALGASVAEVEAAQLAGMADAFRLSALLGIAMGLFCFFLPHTPPAKGERPSAVGEALLEIRKRPLLVLFLLAVPISCIHQFYFVHTAGFLGKFQLEAAAAINAVFGVGGAGLMTIGQMSEILVLAAMPVLAVSLSRKSLLAIGTLAYALRMALFAHVDALPLPELVTLALGVALHGLCFGCWIFVAFMIVDEHTTGDVRASAQSLFNLVIVGIGVIVGSKLATGAADLATTAGELDYTELFSYPMWASVACLVLLLAFYPGGRGERPRERESRPGLRVLTDPSAESGNPELPAFLARPRGASVYHGFPIVEETRTDGWCFGAISAFDDDPDGCEGGDGFVVAPDGSRAGIVWAVGDFPTHEICAADADRWGVYGVAFPRAVRDVDDLVECFRTVLPELRRIHERVAGGTR